MKTKSERKTRAKRKSDDVKPVAAKDTSIDDAANSEPTGWTSTIHHGDCVEGMKQIPVGTVDLVFADPPFNIGYDYDVYDDRLEHEKYVQWCRQWISEVNNVLKPDGAFWLAIGDEYAAELKLASQEIGFHCRSWVVWYYTFGVNCKNKFTRSHAHLFYFVKDPDKFTFHSEDLDNRVPSARELVYNDKRAAANGRLPDDTWIMRPAGMSGEMTADELETWTPTLGSTFVLRPQELESSFTADEDTWYIPRVAGTFKERAGFHGCQMPEQLLGRIIRACSSPGEIVIDPFSGSATTLAVAKKLGRQYAGFDLSPEYVAHGTERLASINVGDRLDGSPEPMKSTFELKSKKEKSKSGSKQASQEVADPQLAEQRYDEIQLELTCRGIVEAFKMTHAGYSADRVVTDPELNAAFCAACERIGIVGSPRAWNMLLFRLRKSGKLSDVATDNRTSVSWQDVDSYLFAAEIAWQQLIDGAAAKSLDEIFCDPQLAERFDSIASQFAPGHTSQEYRWAALKLRKQARVARSHAAVLSPPELCPPQPIGELTKSELKELAGVRGVYVISGEGAKTKSRPIYAGEALDLGARLETLQKTAQVWAGESGQTPLVAFVTLAEANADGNSNSPLAWQSALVNKLHPLWNTFELTSKK